MAILSVIPVLNCRTIDTTLDFYLQLLQFVVVKKRELNGDVHWVHLMHGDTTLMLQAIESPSSEAIHPPLSNISLYFYINNIRQLHHFIKAKNTRVSDIKITDYQTQEFSLIDPEGNTVTVGQAVDKPLT